MKIIKKLSGTAVDGEWIEHHGIRSTVHDEPRPGVIRKISIGDAGVVMHRGEFAAGITREAIIKLLEQIEPGLKCPPPPKVTLDDMSDAELKKLSAAGSTET